MLYLIHGDNTFFSRMALKELCQKQQKTQQVERRDSSSITPGELDSFMQGNTLFAAPHTLVVEGVLSSLPLAQVLSGGYEGVAQNPLHTLICYESKDESKHKIVKQMQGVATEMRHSKMSEQEICAFFQVFFKKDVGVSNVIIRDVYRRCEGDAWMMYFELQKIGAFCIDRVATIKDVEALSVGVLSNNIFATVDAVFAKNRVQAFQRLQGHWASGDSPHMLFAMLERQMRIIVSIKGLLDQGVSQPQEVAQKTSLHPFVVRKTLVLARNFTWSNTQKLYARVASFDDKVKKGYMSPYLAVEVFCFAVCST